ncbi:ABC transporter ATP-binding protein [Evansella tamaricis]|uniref:ABC transporter ATP-binding protein n=1 Tax=Evansella tamaricis TaxID=2069301 RepID=A0ABS6JNT3_9BACI|nr:ABC transporter ATP-binding protein [Evansella tamaricis]MBU9714864.1 ABC transporter ATP-binding protein [Evansella tamaricis]
MIKVKQLDYSYHIGKKGNQTSIPVIKKVSFEVKKGEIVAIVGRSGSGKSTLLNLLSGYISPDSGTIEIFEQNTDGYTEKEWAKFRLDHFGFIFQSYELIPSLTAFENIELPLILKGMKRGERQQSVEAMLKRIGLDQHGFHYPNELSGGQQQRVSIGRALITNPTIILADEPTGSLDSETEQGILDLLQELNEKEGITFLMITHDMEVAKVADRTLALHDGEMEERGVYYETK